MHCGQRLLSERDAAKDEAQPKHLLIIASHNLLSSCTHSRVPSLNLVDHIPHHLVQGGVDRSRRLSASTRQRGPTHSRGSSHHNARGAWQTAAVPPIPVLSNHPT